MPAHGNDAVASGDSSAGAQHATRAVWWKRPVTWVAGVFGAALTATAVAAVSGLLEEGIAEVSKTGPPVSVNQVVEFRSSSLADSVVFPRGTPFTDAELAELNRVNQEGGSSASVEWLENRGGVAPDTVFIQIALAGNRTETVRVTNLEVIPDCSAPLNGILFLSPPAGADDSIVIHFNLDKPNPVAELAYMTGGPPEGESQAYFPTRTISLEKDEQQIVIVTASTAKKYCSFVLDMTVLEGDKTSVQRIAMPDDSPFQVTAWVPEDQYKAVYLGGVICSTWVKANEAYFNEDWEHMCDG